MRLCSRPSPETLLGRCQPRAARRQWLAQGQPCKFLPRRKTSLSGKPPLPAKAPDPGTPFVALPWGCILAGRGPVLQPSASVAQLAAPYVGSSGGPSLQSSLSGMLRGARSHRLPVSLEEAGAPSPQLQAWSAQPLEPWSRRTPLPNPSLHFFSGQLGRRRTQEKYD